ncbi:MAG: hypothetical protein IT324_14070 [Anaerolineae bacterium]|nr:hypothetical protein [Anaerolineae bacterium]
MITSFRKVDEQAALASEIQMLLRNLGAGKVDGVAYDTAWVARLAPVYPGYGFEESLEWLRHHQYDDGTWGAPVAHYHDRYISTLAAIVALKEVGREPRDQRRVQRGEDALWRMVGKLRVDDSDTVGFPMLSVSLAEEAEALGLDVPRPPLRYAGPYQKKVKALLKMPKDKWRASTLSFSLEGLRNLIKEGDSLLVENDSAGTSPSATAAYLLSQTNQPALTYLHNAMQSTGTGAVPAVAPIELFEPVWALNYLRAAGAVTPDNPNIQPLLHHLWQIWSPETGSSYSYYFPIPNIDDTAACLTILRWGGYPVDTEVFKHYEVDTQFCCYHGETNPSVSAHIRLLAALKFCGDYRPEWIEKIVNLLRLGDENGTFWWDKWHASPYYVNSLAVNTLWGIADDLAQQRLKWILRTQNDDGGWGYFGESTPEETAYVLNALLLWDRQVARIEPLVMVEAADYLRLHLNDPYYTPLWIGKSLYTPPNVVKAVILGALFSYES